MTRDLCFTALMLGLLCSPALADSPASKANDSKFQSIFNGKDLKGWNGDPRLWSVRDGAIRGETTAENKINGNSFLIWEDGKTGDFELQLSFRCTAENNSGIQYRSEHNTGKGAPNKWSIKGYQHEIRNEVDMPNVSGFIYGEGLGRGRICLAGEKAVQKGDKKEVLETLITADEFKELFRLDEWNDVRIVAKGRHIQHFLNGRLILDFTDSPEKALLDGVLALQLHAGKPMWTEFKDIRIRSL